MNQDSYSTLIIILTCLAPVVGVTGLMCTVYARFLHSFWKSAPEPMARGKAAKPVRVSTDKGSPVFETKTADGTPTGSAPSAAATLHDPVAPSDKSNGATDDFIATLNPESRQLMERYLPQVDYIARQFDPITTKQITFDHLREVGRQGLVQALAHLGDEPAVGIDTLTSRHIKRSIIGWLCQVSPGFADGFHRISAADLARMTSDPMKAMEAVKAGGGKWIDRLIDDCMTGAGQLRHAKHHRAAEYSANAKPAWQVRSASTEHHPAGTARESESDA